MRRCVQIILVIFIKFGDKRETFIFILIMQENHCTSIDIRVWQKMYSCLYDKKIAVNT